VTENDVKFLGWPEVTSFDRKSPGSGCRRPITRAYCTFYFLQGCSSQEKAATWLEMTSRDLRWPLVTLFDRKSPGSGCRRTKTRVYCTFHFLQGCTSQQEAVTCQEMTSVTSGDRNSPESDVIWLEVNWKWLYTTKNSRTLYISLPTRP